MSTAHRPTWDPAQAKDVKGGSRQYSSRDMASHTKLKFRYGAFQIPESSVLIPHSQRQAGQTSVVEVSKRDLRAELLAAEQEAREKKRKADGQPGATLAIENKSSMDIDDDSSKRRKLLQEALELDKDDDEDEEDIEEELGYISPLDTVDPYITFKQALTGTYMYSNPYPVGS